MKIETFVTPPVATNCYLLADEHSGECILIDAGSGILEQIRPVIEREKWHLQMVLLTHSHFDHIAGARAVVDAYHVPLYVHKQDLPNVQKPGSDGLPLFIHVAPVAQAQALAEGGSLACGTMQIKILSLPGHSPGCVGFYLEKEGLLFSGDALFAGTYGRTDLPGSDPQKMKETLQNLMELPGATRVLSGHGKSTTIEREKSSLLY